MEDLATDASFRSHHPLRALSAVERVEFLGLWLASWESCKHLKLLS